MNDQDLFQCLIDTARSSRFGVRLLVARYGESWRVGLAEPIQGPTLDGWHVVGWLEGDDGPRHYALEQAAAVALAMKADALDVPSLQGWAHRVTVVLDDEPPAAIVV